MLFSLPFCTKNLKLRENKLCEIISVSLCISWVSQLSLSISCSFTALNIEIPNINLDAINLILTKWSKMFWKCTGPDPKCKPHSFTKDVTVCNLISFFLWLNLLFLGFADGWSSTQVDMQEGIMTCDDSDLCLTQKSCTHLEQFDFLADGITMNTHLQCGCTHCQRWEEGAVDAGYHCIQSLFVILFFQKF